MNNTINQLTAENTNLNKQLLDNPNDSNISNKITSNNNRISSLIDENKKITSEGDSLDQTTYKNKSDFMNSMNENTYIDDLDINSLSKSYNIIKPSSQLTNMVNPVTNSGYVETTTDNNQGIYSALLSQYYGSTTNGLQTVNIDIRLDPYWISGKNNNYTEKVVGISEEDYGIQNYFKDGFCHFLLNYQTPNGLNEKTGNINLNISDLYSGVYQVISVMSRFEEGKMIQTLTGNKICTLTIGRILSGIDINKIGNSNSDISTSLIGNNYINSVNKNSDNDDEWHSSSNLTNTHSLVSIKNTNNIDQKTSLNNLIKLVR